MQSLAQLLSTADGELQRRELTGQLEWLKDLRELLESGDTETAIDITKMAEGVVQRQIDAHACGRESIGGRMSDQ